MRVRVFLSLFAVAIAATVLASASGAGATKVAKSSAIDVSTRAAVIDYLRSIHVDPRGVVIQRGVRNYAGSHCPGRGWSCTSTAHPVVQVAGAGGKNTFSCSTPSCAVVQFARAAAADNTAKCIKILTLTQSCTINQSSASANNVAVVYEAEVGALAPTQTASQTASITQQATGASNTNTACVSQNVLIDGSTATTKTTPLNVTLEAHQTLTVKQDSSNGGNAAQSSATLVGTCDTGHPLTQRQILNSVAAGRGSITQSEDAANGGANMTIDVEQNQTSGFGLAHGPNSANFNQSDSLTAVADTPAGPVNQTQSSAAGGLLGTINQASRDVSTATATQTETQCEDAHTTASLKCDHATSDAPSYSLTQTQFGPVQKGVGTATQTGNTGDTFTVNQSSQQDNDTGSGQTNVVHGDCSTTGNCNVNQTTNVDGQTHTNNQSGQDVSTSTNCTGSTCTSSGGAPTFTQNGAQLTATNVDVAEFGYGGMRENTGTTGTPGDGTGSISVSGVNGTVLKALLYWNGPTSSEDPNSNADVSFADTPINGTNIGTAGSNCWDNSDAGVSYTNSQSYVADVTSLVSGNGSYDLSNFVKTDETNNVVADINGVALVVFYDDGNSSNNRNVVLWAGNDSNVAFGNDPAGWDETLTGVPGSSSDGTLDMIVSDGQSYPDGAVVVNGTTTIVGDGGIFQGASTPHGAADANGDLWDVESFGLPSSLLTSSSNTLHLTSAAAGDCLSLVVAAANVPVQQP